jgi:hypothetical protein
MMTEISKSPFAGVFASLFLKEARVRCVLYRAVSLLFLVFTLVCMAPVVSVRFYFHS